MFPRVLVSAPILLCCIGAVPMGSTPDREAPEYEMTTYQFVLLRRGPDQQPIGERETVRLQEAHLEYLGGLLAEGKAIIFGPLAGGGDLHSAVVLDVGSVEAAEAIFREDSWVAAGRLTPEIHPWWAAKGILQQPANYRHMSRCYLGLLQRPPGAPEYPEEKLQEIQAGHMANIQKMADSGDLVIAGPMGDDGALRGIFVFRTLDTDRIREMVARDPAVKMGRLGIELYPWHVPQGSLPEP